MVKVTLTLELDNQEFYNIIYPKPFLDEEGREIPVSFSEVADSTTELDYNDEARERLAGYIADNISSGDISLDAEVYVSDEEYQTEIKYLEARKAWLNKHRA